MPLSSSRLTGRFALALAFLAAVPALPDGLPDELPDGAERFDPEALSSSLARLDARVLGEAGASRAPRMLEEHARALLEAANRRETGLWRELKGREDWERYRDARLTALSASL